jgi:hypothetical protein
MTNKSRIALIAALATMSFAAPALAQSFNPAIGTGNELPAQYDNSGKLVRGNIGSSHEQSTVSRGDQANDAMVQ